MGRLVDGKWTQETWKHDKGGRFVRDATSFRRTVSRDPSSDFPAVRGRYHLYVSYACPWAHRTLITRALAGLEDAVSVSVVDWFMGEDGWRFAPDVPGATPDHVNGAGALREIYVLAKSDYTGRVTVPVLWDKETRTIVNNESRQIIRMLDRELASKGERRVQLFPADLDAEIEATLDAIYEPINNGVYRSGFATSQAAYDEAVTELFAALDHWDAVLGEQRYLLGDRLTAADVCMFTTLVRFDLVYYTHFKCNRRHVYEYPNLGPYVRDLYQIPGIAQTCNFEHIKRHYYESHESINPRRIVPIGPVIDHGAPHDRDRFGRSVL